MYTAETTKLSWIIGVTRREMIRNDYFRRSVKVVHLRGSLREWTREEEDSAEEICRRRAKEGNANSI